MDKKITLAYMGLMVKGGLLACCVCALWTYAHHRDSSMLILWMFAVGVIGMLLAEVMLDVVNFVLLCKVAKQDTDEDV